MHLLCLLPADCPGCCEGTGPTSWSLCSWVVRMKGNCLGSSCTTCQEVVVSGGKAQTIIGEAGWGLLFGIRWLVKARGAG